MRSRLRLQCPVALRPADKSAGCDDEASLRGLSLVRMVQNPKSKIQNPKSGTLEVTLRSVQARLRLREGVSLLPIAVTLGLAAALALVIVGRFRPGLAWPTLLVSGLGFVLAAVLTVFAYALLRPRDLMATARRA